MPKPKKNRAVVVRESELRKIKNEATSEAIRNTTALFLMTLRDKEGHGVEDLQRVFRQVNALAELVSENVITLSALRKILEDEANITIS